MPENKNIISKCGCFTTHLLQKIFFVDFLKGLTLTLYYGLTKEVTLQYPDKEKWIPYQRFRGRHTLNRDEEGRELCVACELCSKACPTDCITVIPMEDDTGRGIIDRVAKVWEVDLVRCLFCGYCEDACPTTAVRLGREFELACYERGSAVYERDKLLEPTSVPEHQEGGIRVKARLVKDADGIRVVPDFTKKRKSFW
jgi:NADH-quinone oxidoreductase subunit I